MLVDEQTARLIVSEMRAYFDSGATRDVQMRISFLKALLLRTGQMEQEIYQALYADLGKGEAEAYLTEIALVKAEIRYFCANLPRLCREKHVFTPIHLFPASSRRIAEPYGVCLVMAPWNYPIQLSLLPLIGAIAAGNCVLLKPSSYAPACAVVLKKLLSCLPSGLVRVVTGGRNENRALLGTRFDLIFFTGGGFVGKQVLRAAAEYLTPCVLELGGKSPCLVLADADPELAAKRILFGKIINAGQTCVAPDYVLVQKSMHDALAAALEKQLRLLCPKDPLTDPQYPRIVSRKHFDRLTSLLKGDIAIGGDFDAQALKISPTVIDHADALHPAMQEEIFGPILPVLEMDNLDEMISFLRTKEKPLALYLFTRDPHTMRRVERELSFGGGCINDVLLHLTNDRLPFGGVGASGMGSYHGKQSFETFTHRKSVLHKGLYPDPPMRYMPYGKAKLGILRRFF